MSIIVNNSSIFSPKSVYLTSPFVTVSASTQDIINIESFTSFYSESIVGSDGHDFYIGENGIKFYTTDQVGEFNNDPIGWVLKNNNICSENATKIILYGSEDNSKVDVFCELYKTGDGNDPILWRGEGYAYVAGDSSRFMDKSISSEQAMNQYFSDTYSKLNMIVILK